MSWCTDLLTLLFQRCPFQCNFLVFSSPALDLTFEPVQYEEDSLESLKALKQYAAVILSETVNNTSSQRGVFQ